MQSFSTGRKVGCISLSKMSLSHVRPWTAALLAFTAIERLTTVQRVAHVGDVRNGQVIRRLAPGVVLQQWVGRN